MEMTRRSFGKRTLMVLTALVAGFESMGVACSTIWNDILKYVPVGLSAFTSIINILSGGGVLTLGAGTAIDAIVALINKGFADLQAATNQYQANPQPTTGGKVSEIITILTGNIQQFWNDLQIPDQKMATLVQGLCGVILSTLAGFLPSLPPPTPAVVGEVQRKAVKWTNIIKYVPQKRSLKQFKVDFNTLLTQAGPDFTQHKI